MLFEFPGNLPKLIVLQSNCGSFLNVVLNFGVSNQSLILLRDSDYLKS